MISKQKVLARRSNQKEFTELQEILDVIAKEWTFVSTNNITEKSIESQDARITITHF